MRAAASPTSPAVRQRPVSGAGGTRGPRSTAHNSLAGSEVTGAVVQAGEIHGLTVYGQHPGSSTAGPTLPTLPVPRQLPPVPRRLIGRSDDLARLDGELGEAVGPVDLTVVLTGPAGVGKTALGVQWLRRHADRFPDGQLFADLRAHAPGGPAEPAEVLAGFLRAFGVVPVPSGLAEGTALWRSLAADRRIAVLLDDACTAAQVRPLLPGSEHAVVVVTSRRRLTRLDTDGAVVRPVDLLSDEASVRLLAQRVGVERVAREPAAAALLVERCGRLPLALCLAAARITARPAQPQPLLRTAEAVGDATGRLAALDVGEEGMGHALDASVATLGAGAVRLYQLLGLLRFPVFTPDVVRVLGDLERGEAEQLLDRLIDIHLLEETAEGFRFHGLVKLHARALGDEIRDRPEGRAAVDRVLDWYLATTTAAEALLTPSHRTLRRDFATGPVPERFVDEAAAVGWLDAETERLADAVRWAADTGRAATAWQLVDAMWPLFLQLRPVPLWVEAHRIGRIAARAAGHRDGELRMLTSGGAGLRNVGRGAEAAEWYTEALHLARASSDGLAEADALYGLGETHRAAGRFAEAADCLRRTADIRAARGYRRGTALARLALGSVMLEEGRAADAVPVITGAHRDLAALPTAYEAARALAFLGRAHTVLGAHEEARRCLAEALEVFRAGRARRWEARVLELVGDLARARGDLAEAAARWRESLALYQALDAPDTARVAAAVALDAPTPPGSAVGHSGAGSGSAGGTGG